MAELSAFVLKLITKIGLNYQHLCPRLGTIIDCLVCICFCAYYRILAVLSTFLILIITLLRYCQHCIKAYDFIVTVLAEFVFTLMIT
jgi:hypothetical protein